MEPETPAAPPEARLIRTAREAAGMTATQAAQATGGAISATYWRDVERGYGGRRGQRAAARASDMTLAAMARVTGVTPEQLIGARREEAARVLAEILRREGRPAPAEVPQPPGAVLAAADTPVSDPQDDAAARLFPGDTRHDRIIRNIWRLGQYGTSREDRLDMIEVVDPGLAAALRDVGGQSEVGLGQLHVRLQVHGNNSDTSGVSGSHRTVPARHH